MAKITNKLKLAWLKGVEVMGTTASNLASNAKFKVAEINLETKRREVMSEFTQKAYDMWQGGEVFPEPLNGMLKDASDLDERLSILRAQRYASVGGEQGKPEAGQSGDAANADAVGEEQTTEQEAQQVAETVAAPAQETAVPAEPGEGANVKEEPSFYQP